jgi:PPP family 3-phenylpropionic acid transporter
MHIVRLASLASILAFAGVLIDSSYLWLAFVMLMFSFFWNATLPQFEANTLQHLGEHSHHYSKIRVWGSVGFIAIVMALGQLLEYFSIAIMPYAMILMLAGIWLSSLYVPESTTRHLQIDHRPFKQLITQPAVLTFLVVCFLMLVSHGPYYTFYSIYLENHHYSRSFIGQLWALGVLAEVVVFLFMHRWLPYYGLRKVLLVSLLLAALRWLLIGFFPGHLIVIVFAQLLHAASFGTFHVAAIAWVHEHFVGQYQGRGQALYSMIGFGAGGVVGSLSSGYLWQTPGPTATFTLAALVSLLAYGLAWRWLKY